VIAANVGTLGIELLLVDGFVLANTWSRIGFYVAVNLLLFGALFAPLLARRRAVVFIAMLFSVPFAIYLYSPIAFNPPTSELLED
jgi:hypothetical protein